MTIVKFSKLNCVFTIVFISLHSKNYIDDEDVERLVSMVNRIPEIVAAVKIDPKKIKSRENLLF